MSEEDYAFDPDFVAGEEYLKGRLRWLNKEIQNLQDEKEELKEELSQTSLG